MNVDEVKEKMQKLNEETFCIEVQKLEGGMLPFKKHATDAGFDLFATSDIELHPGQVIKHPLNIRMKLPKGTWASITTKSGLGAKGQLVYAGVIDEGYRGVPHVIMTNVQHLVDTGSRLMANSEPILLKPGRKWLK